MSLSYPRAEKSVNFYILGDLGGFLRGFGGIWGGLGGSNIWGVVKDGGGSYP